MNGSSTIEPQEDNGLTCQTRFQVKSGRVFSNQLNQLIFSDYRSIRIHSSRSDFTLALTNKYHSQSLTLANVDWDQSFPIPQDVKSEISHWLTVSNQWNGKLRLYAHNRCLGITLKKGNKIINHVVKSSRNKCAVNGLSRAMSETEQLQAEDSNRQNYQSLIHQQPKEEISESCITGAIYLKSGSFPRLH
ncbi:hypothetical protein ACTFIW_005429 [Dictyostelium discoideum]